MSNQVPSLIRVPRKKFEKKLHKFFVCVMIIKFLSTKMVLNIDVNRDNWFFVKELYFLPMEERFLYEFLKCIDM